VWLNSIFLPGQSFIPFPTAMVGRYPKNALAVSFFGCVFALNTLLFMALQAYIVRRLIKPELATLQDPSGLREAPRRPIVLSARRRCGMDQYAGGLRNLCVDAIILHHADARVTGKRPTRSPPWSGREPA